MRVIPGTQGRTVIRRKTVPSDRCGKQAHSSRKIAAAAAKRASKESGERIEVYHCRRGCHAWHIGHPPGTKEAVA